MIIVCAIQTIFSFFIKVLLDSHIDDFLRKNGHKSLAKKREIKKRITHSDIKEIVPRSYIIYNFSVYTIWLFVILLTIISFFVSMETKDILRAVGCFIIIAESSLVAFIRICEVLFDKHTKLWNKFLLVATIIAVIVFIFFWD